MTVLHPSGQYAYVVNPNDETVSQYTIGSDGSLSAMTTATVAAGSYPIGITVVCAGADGD